MSQFIGLMFDPTNKKAFLIKPLVDGPCAPFFLDQTQFNNIAQNPTQDDNTGVPIKIFEMLSRNPIIPNSGSDTTSERNRFNSINSISVYNPQPCILGEIDDVPILGVSFNMFGFREIPFPDSYKAQFTVVGQGTTLQNRPTTTFNGNIVHECPNFYSLVFTDTTPTAAQINNAYGFLISFDEPPANFGSYGLIPPSTAVCNTGSTIEKFQSFAESGGTEKLLWLFLSCIILIIIVFYLLTNLNQL